jgi:hypothetical protein
MHPKLQKLIDYHKAGRRFDITIDIGNGDEDWYIYRNDKGEYYLNHSEDNDIDAIGLHEIEVHLGNPVEFSLCFTHPEIGDCDMTIWEPRVMIADFFGTNL